MTGRFIRESRLDREAVASELRKFLDAVLAGTKLNVTYSIETRAPAAEEYESPEIVAVFSGPDQDVLLEQNAAVLNAMEYLAVRCLRLDPDFYDHVRLDAGNFRAARLEELKISARIAAERARDTRQPIHFQPMSARERRIVHLALHDFPGVRTVSEGSGPDRHLVIYPSETNPR